MSQSHYTVLIVEDSPEDRELYRRFLLKDESSSYRILEATTGQQGLTLWQQQQPDLVLLDYRLPDLDGLEVLAQLQDSRQQSCLPVVMLTGLGNEEIAVKAIKAGAQDYLVKGQMTLEGFHLAIHGAIATVRLHTQLHQRIERERVVSQITRQIHRSLDLDEILHTTVDEVRKFLQTDRVVVFRLQSDDSGLVITESVGSGWTSLLDTSFHDPCFNANYVEPFQWGLVTVKPDIYDGSIDPCHVELLASLQVRANLVVPILQDNQLWGMLIAHHCAAPRQWESIEIDLLKELATQVGIALQQAELYQQRDHLLAQEQRARIEAERANRVKDEFLAILSHELRSPLNPILGWTKLMQSGNFSPTKTAEALAVIERNAKLQIQLVDDLLDTAKILRGKLSLTVAPIDLVFVIEAAIDTVKAALTAKSIHLQLSLPQVGSVAGDATRLQQILWNLLSNAIKFTPAGGQVEVRLERWDEGHDQSTPYAQITVRDTGKGIDPKVLPHLFEPFWQEDSSVSRKYGGLGLGLAIVRYLVEAHGGRVWAESQGVDRGATFTMRLPLLSHEVVSAHPTAPPNQADLTGVRVLAIDDERDARELLSAILSHAKAEFVTVATAAELLSSLDSFQPDIVISDIGMPDVDGYTLMRQVRSRSPEAGGQIPAIALTAYAKAEDRQRALAAGFHHHLAKPVDPALLVQSILTLTRPTEAVRS